MTTLKIAGRHIRIKANSCPLQPEHSNHYQISTKDSPTSLKVGLQRNPYIQNGSVSLPTQYKNQKLDVLYLLVEGDFTQMLGCDACLNQEVIKFTNL